MGWLFRRGKGRHAVGATGRPAPTPALAAPMAAAPPAPVAPAPSPAPVEAEPPPAVVRPPRPAVDLLPAPSYAPVPPSEPPAGPRGELMFRDGTTAELDPEQARALDEIAQQLITRSEVKH